MCFAEPGSYWVKKPNSFSICKGLHLNGVLDLLFQVLLTRSERKPICDFVLNMVGDRTLNWGRRWGQDPGTRAVLRVLRPGCRQCHPGYVNSGVGATEFTETY